MNEALELYQGGDVLFVNADIVLPPGAIERLRRAVYSAPEIGTATPFSNNGEFTSFPVPYRSNPLPSIQEIESLDRRFAGANDGVAIPIPNGIGFCLYVKRECFEAVGSLSPLYAPGYGEDIEFCLSAREKGFVNVCAADVFVGHAGSLSFRAAKRAYVVRNLRVLHERFPITASNAPRSSTRIRFGTRARRRTRTAPCSVDSAAICRILLSRRSRK